MEIIEVSKEQARTLNILYETFLIFVDIPMKTEKIVKRANATAVKAIFQTNDRRFEYQIAKNGAIIKAIETSMFGTWIADLK